MKTFFSKGQRLSASFLQRDGLFPMLFDDLFLAECQHGTAEIYPHDFERKRMSGGNFQGDVGGPGGDVQKALPLFWGKQINRSLSPILIPTGTEHSVEKVIL